MSWAEAAWVGPTLVAVVASAVTYATHRSALRAEHERWTRERDAAVRDRRLETVREGYLSLMAAAGAFAAVMDEQGVGYGERNYVLDWYEALKSGLRESGGVVDAYGSEASRAALERTRQLMALSYGAEEGLEAATREKNAPTGYDVETLTGHREDAASDLRMRASEWRAALVDLLGAMRDDLRGFEPDGQSRTKPASGETPAVRQHEERGGGVTS